jgi:hypothetical protein
MAFRIETGTQRPAAIEFSFDGLRVRGHPGETLAAALLAVGITGFREDVHGRARAPYCNMGICFECLVEVRVQAEETQGLQHGTWHRVRACLIEVAPGLSVRRAPAAKAVEPAHG